MGTTQDSTLRPSNHVRASLPSAVVPSFPSTVALPTRVHLPGVEAAYRRVYAWVLAAAREAGLEEFEQEEAVQRLGLVLVEKQAEHDASKGSWTAWAVGIARNLILDLRRAVRRARRRELRVSVDRLPDPSLTPEQLLRAREALAIVRAAVREDAREVFELDALGCSAIEIGDMLGLPPSTVAWKLREARRDLTRALARMREDRSEVPRVRAVVWPFASTSDLARALRGEGALPPVAPVRGRLPRALVFFLGWSGALSRVVVMSLASLVLSVHLVRVLPADLDADRAVVSEHTLTSPDPGALDARASRPSLLRGPQAVANPGAQDGPASAGEPRTDVASANANANAGAASPPAPVPSVAGVAKPVRPVVLTEARDARPPARRGSPREWMILRHLVQGEAKGRRAAARPPASNETGSAANEPAPPRPETTAK